MQKIVVVGKVTTIWRTVDEDILSIDLASGRVIGIIGTGGHLRLRRKPGHGYSPGDKIVVTVEYYDETA